jgi:hypothetical protein
MSAWEASEAVVDKTAVRLVTYRYSGKTERRIDRSRVWVATSNKIYAEQITGSTMQHNLKVFGHYLDVDAPP